MWRKLRIILWKNVLIRKRHWFLTVAEILIPILLFALVAYGRSNISGMNKIIVEHPTYHEIRTEEDIYIHLDVGELSLWYTPYTDFTEKIITKVQHKLQIQGDAVKEFQSKKDLLGYFNTNGKNHSLIAAIVFKGNNTKHLNYDLSLYNKYLGWDTNKLFETNVVPIVEGRTSKYIYNGFAALQVAIDIGFMELHSPQKSFLFSIQEFPYPPHTNDSGLNQLFIYCLPLVTIFSFIFLCPAVLKRVGEEKVSGTREYLKMVGFESWVLWMGWFIHALLTNIISITAIIIFMKVPFWGVPYPPIEYSDGTVLFVFLFLYCMAAITFCCLLATVLTRPSIATVVGILVWIFSYFIPQALLNSHENLSWKLKILLAIFPNMALHYGYSSVSVYEMREIGIQWYNIFNSGTGSEDDVTMGNVFLMLVYDIIMFMLLTIYIENVRPGEYGIPKPYSFPLIALKNAIKKRYFNGRRVEDDAESMNTHDEEQRAVCIKIRKLHKKFYKTVAVDNLSLDIYENYITVLLGHNGAGKTTTMSILTGMIDATSGFVAIKGKEIKSHINDCRKMIGLCPQHNLLFPDLTVIEHLQFFAMVRGSDNASEEAKFMSKHLGLDMKENDLTNTLSGGMKRKLCLGMAMVGDPKVLVLDEPTSGMDPESRRKVWDLLLEYRKSKTILITTHFMEEADVLGDWVAIMANGSLQCYDTPIHLKEKYNTGYHLSLLLKSKNAVDNITTVVKKHIPNAELLRQTENTIVYLLPMNKKSYYQNLFDALEKTKEELNIVNMDLKLTTLNDVFLKAKDEIDGVAEREVFKENRNEIVNPKLQRGMQREVNNLCAMMVKRFWFLKKKYYWYIPAFVVSAGIFVLALWLGTTNTSYYNGGPELNLSLATYGKTQVYYGGEKSSDATLLKLRETYKEIVIQEKSNPIFENDVSGGIVQAGINNIAQYRKHVIVAAEFNKSKNNDIIINAMYSSIALHGAPIAINMALDSAVKILLGGNYSITTRNAPLTLLDSEYAPSELSAINVGSTWIILIPMSMLFFISNFIIFPNLEVSTNFIQIQTMAGINTYFYWFTNFVFDCLLSVLQLVVLFSIIVLINWLMIDLDLGMTEIEMFAALFASYIVASLPFTYLLSYRKTITGGISWLIMFGIFIGITPAIIIVAMEFSNIAHYTEIAKYLKHTFAIFSPQFMISYICVKFAKKYVENFNWKYMDPNKRGYICHQEPNPCCFDESSADCTNYRSYLFNEKLGIVEDLLELCIPLVLYFILLLTVNTEVFKKAVHFVKYFPCKIYSLVNKEKEDYDENDCLVDRSNNTNNGEPKTLYVDSLTKTFGRKTIVNNLKLQLKKNKCFGLLGVNGAGKSTTFRILTKYLFFDKGEVKVSEESIPISKQEYSKYIGYCPQEDSLNYFLTGEELVCTIARLKGYSKEEALVVTDTLLNHFGLKKHAKKPCLEYSGGNKRKLNTCIAFLGQPKVVLLDEPTSGVDPASRRIFWNILNYFKKEKNTSFLLCSHSMEECEYLCDEIAIMKKGRIEAQGSLLELKNKYHKGFKIILKLKCAVEDIAPLQEKFASELNAYLKEAYGETLEFQARDCTKTLGELFRTLETLKKQHEEIDDYSVSQISLEDIFLSVADNN